MVLLRNSRWIYVLESGRLRLCVLQYSHNHPLAGHFGQTKHYIQVWMHYYWPGLLVFVKDYTEIMYQLFPCQTCHHKPYRFLNSFQFRLTLGIPSWWILREAPFIFQLYLDPSHCLITSQSSHSSISTHDTLTSPQLVQLFVSTFSPSMAFQAMSFRHSMEFLSTSSGPSDCIGHETSFHFQISSKGDRQLNKLIRLWKIPLSLLQLPTRQLVQILH